MPKTVWNGRLEDYPLENYPDYRPGKPPDLFELQKYGYLDEYERIWGKPWGSVGIGKLREVALIKPDGEHEGNPLWQRDPNFFMLRYRQNLDIDLLLRSHEEYARLLESLDIKIYWMEFEDTMGAWGPMRKLFMAEEVKVLKGGAIIPRFSHASFKRGLEREFQKFLTKIGCPILLTVHGTGICEVAPMTLPIAEGVFMAGLSCACNQEGLDQVLPVLYRSGVKEVHIMHLPTIMDSFESGGEFHVDMVLAALDDHVVLVWPDNLPWTTYRWLRERSFKIIEVPADEQRKYEPANLLLLEPGKVIMHKGAVKTIKAVEQAGVEVIPFDSSGIMQGGTNGMRCITMELLRNEGPGLAD
ncbi:MAG: hypothetical protein HY675_08760 [Chloroflexi bacterium]|nr:hypothetical protein [Chloroflexota bacterium]